jgi:hypothetical protein
MTTSTELLRQLPESRLTALEQRLQSEREQRTNRTVASTDFEIFAKAFLRIRTKTGAIAPLTFNRAQRFIHNSLEEQRVQTGKVRALILKGRQQGCSTYIGGRFFHKTIHQGGIRTFILTHEDQATANLFEMVSRFHSNLPLDMQPSTGKANAKELIFDMIDRVDTRSAPLTPRASAARTRSSCSMAPKSGIGRMQRGTPPG